jgi:hypothetical protein
MSIISDATMKTEAVVGDPAQIEKAIRTVAMLKKRIVKEQPDEDCESTSSAENSVNEVSPSP